MSSYVWIGMHVCAKSLGVAPGLSNARPLGSTKLANTPPPGKTRPVARGGGGTLGISGWGCVAGTLEPLTYTRASSAEFCYPILE